MSVESKIKQSSDALISQAYSTTMQTLIEMNRTSTGIWYISMQVSACWNKFDTNNIPGDQYPTPWFSRRIQRGRLRYSADSLPPATAQTIHSDCRHVMFTLRKIHATCRMQMKTRSVVNLLKISRNTPLIRVYYNRKMCIHAASSILTAVQSISLTSCCARYILCGTQMKTRIANNENCLKR